MRVSAARAEQKHRLLWIVLAVQNSAIAAFEVNRTRFAYRATIAACSIDREIFRGLKTTTRASPVAHILCHSTHFPFRFGVQLVGWDQNFGDQASFPEHLVQAFCLTDVAGVWVLLVLLAATARASLEELQGKQKQGSHTSWLAWPWPCLTKKINRRNHAHRSRLKILY
jgi:hypothetical protein